MSSRVRKIFAEVDQALVEWGTVIYKRAESPFVAFRQIIRDASKHEDMGNKLTRRIVICRVVELCEQKSY